MKLSETFDVNLLNEMWVKFHQGEYGELRFGQAVINLYGEEAWPDVYNQTIPYLAYIDLYMEVTRP